MVNVLLAATHSNSFTTCGLRGQGQGMVNVLLAASPATRSRPRMIKGQEPGLVDVLLQPPEQTRSRRGRAEVVNELLWVAAKRTFTSPGPWPLIFFIESNESLDRSRGARGGLRISQATDPN